MQHVKKTSDILQHRVLQLMTPSVFDEVFILFLLVYFIGIEMMSFSVLSFCEVDL